MADWPVQSQGFNRPVIATLSSAGVPTDNLGSSTASRAWPTANKAMYCPIRIYRPVTITQMFCLNGSAVSGNIDMAVYDEAGNRLCTNGGTAQTGIGVTQTLDVTDTLLLPGRYYWAMAADNTTTTVYGTAASITTSSRLSGLYEQTSAYPLPSTATLTASTTNFVPLVCATSRSFV